MHTPQWIWLAAAGWASAQSIVDELSFGHRGYISPNKEAIPGWDSSSVNHQIQVLSDRIILTPPVPGSTKGSLWTQSPVAAEEWSIELDFRAAGQDSGSGNLQLWYTKDKGTIGTDSVYNAGNFDGIVLLVDQYGGTGGKVRGFLNDGSQDFRVHRALESLAFGHCDYPYRNLGRPSRLRLTNKNGLSVSIDDRECFSSDKISLPSGYFVGVTASTAEDPDSFEIQRIVTSYEGQSQQQSGQQQSDQQQSNQQNSGGNRHRWNSPPPPTSENLDAFPGSPEAVPDAAADQFQDTATQFADLHNRLQAMSHLAGNMFMELKRLSLKIDDSQAAVISNMQNMQGSKDTGLPPEIVGAIYKMNQRVENIEKALEQLRKDAAGKDYGESFNRLQRALDNVQGGLTDHLPEKIGHLMRSSAPRIGLFVFVVVAVQVMLAGAYILYKRRRANMPKKYI